MAMNQPQDPWALFNSGVDKKIEQAVEANQQPILDRLDTLENQVLTGATNTATQVAADTVVRFHANPKWELALGVIATGVIGAAGLIVLVFYLNGNKQAADIKDFMILTVVPAVWKAAQVYLAPKVPVVPGTVVGPSPTPAPVVAATPVLVAAGSIPASPPVVPSVAVRSTGNPPPPAS